MMVYHESVMGGWFVIYHDSMIAHHNIKLYRLQMLINNHNLRYFIFFWLFLIDFIHGYYYFAFSIVIILHCMMAYYHYMTDIIILLCTGIICIIISIPYITSYTYSSLLYYQESIDMIRFLHHSQSFRSPWEWLALFRCWGVASGSLFRWAAWCGSDHGIFHTT